MTKIFNITVALFTALELFAFADAHGQVASGSSINLSVNGYYASAANGGGSNVTVDRSAALSWEAFTVSDLYNSYLNDGDSIQLQAKNGNYLAAECGGGIFGDNRYGSACGPVNANRFVALGWETFTIVALGGSEGSLIQSGDQIALQSLGGYYCSAVNGGGDGSYMNCATTELGGWETWTVNDSSTQPPIYEPPTGSGLKDQPLVTSGRVMIGSAAKINFSVGDPDYLATFAREYNILTIEGGASMRATQPDPASAFSSVDGWGWGRADAIVSFAQQNGIVVRGDLVATAAYDPDWFVYGGYTPNQMYQIMVNRITTEITHLETNFPGVVQYWDVVNEGITDGCTSTWTPVGAVGVPEYRDPCLSYIFTAFRIARNVTNSINPNIKLVFNEYGAEGTYENCSAGGSSKACQVYQLVKDLKAQGLVDVVGLQMHWHIDQPDFAAIQYNIQQLGQLGLEVQITEMDVGLNSPNPPDSDLQWQASIYAGVAQACLAEANCSAIITWDFVDKYTWLIEANGLYAPLPFDTNYSPKPAYFALQRALGGR